MARTWNRYWLMGILIGALALGGGSIVLRPAARLSMAMGGPGVIETDASLAKMELQAQKLRLQRESLAKREAVLRQKLTTLQYGLHASSNPASLQRNIQRSTEMLRSLLMEQKVLERRLLGSLRQMWDARASALALGIPKRKAIGPITLSWPVKPLYGVSAGFADPNYRKRFGFDHRAIDIPAEQRSVVTAAADGVVTDVSDNEYGFNAITIRHDGFVTLYGHTESFLVSEGMEVRAGEPIARSGGMPGTIGAGHLSTGPHVHFELIVDGEHQDPLAYLPKQATE